MKKKRKMKWLACALAAELLFSSFSNSSVVFATESNEVIVTEAGSGEETIEEIGSEDEDEIIYTEADSDAVEEAEESADDSSANNAEDDLSGAAETTVNGDSANTVLTVVAEEDSENSKESDNLCEHGNDADSCSICAVQVLIDALPEAKELEGLSTEELNEVYAALLAADEAFTELSADEQDLVDDSRVDALYAYFSEEVAAADEEETSYVAMIGEDGYDSLQAAINAAQSGDTITLQTDLSVADNGKSATFFTIDKGITLDLNNHTITANLTWTANVLFKLKTSETVTIKNGTINGSTTSKAGVIENYNYLTSYSSNNTLKLENLTITEFGTAGSYNNSYSNQSLIYLNGALSLSISNCNISNNGFRAFYFDSDISESSVVVSNSTISNNYTYGNLGGGFYIARTDVVTISNCTIEKNYGTNTTLLGAGFYVSGCDSVTIKGNTIADNKAMKKGTSGSTKSYGGGFYLIYDGTINISQNTISGNSSDKSGGGGYIKWTDGDLIVTGNTITGNSSKGYGGGLYISNSADYEFGKVEITGNTISQNTVGWGTKEDDDNNVVRYYSKGGGLCLYDNATSHSDSSVYDLSGNTITNNSTALNSEYSRGGGLSLYGSDANKNFLIASGTITGNKADWGGGIDYTYHCAATLILYNAIITENTAARGGGLWSCPSSTTTMYVTLGGTIYENTASGLADSIRFEGTDSDYATGEGGVFATVAARALGGTLMDWYSDETDARYADGDATVDIADYTDRETSFSLHGELSEEGIALAEAASTLLIANNTATQVGGGIASNAGVEFGTDGEVSVTVTKEWETSSGNTPDESLLPESVTIQLVRVDSEGNEVNLESVELTADDDWSYTFSELPTNYTYKVVETSSGDFTVSYSDAVENEDGNYAITLTNVIETVDISGTKTWDDANNQDGKRPETITVNLLADGEIVDSIDVTEAEDGTWTYSFTDLPKYADGVEIEYAVLEEAVKNYSTTYDGYDITNSYTPEQTSVSVTKVWNDGSNADGIRPSTVTITLLKNGVSTEETLTLSASNNWTGSFTALDKYTDGTENVYTVTEATVSGYTTTITGSASEGFVATNTHTVTTTEDPGDPKDPEDPDDTTEAEETTETTETVEVIETVSAATGDSSPIGFMIALTAICGMMLVAMVSFQEKKHRK